MNIYNRSMALVDLLFPKFCLNCHLPGVYICPSCQKQLKYYDRSDCFFCKKSSLNNLTHAFCLKKFNIDGVIPIFHYNPLMRKIIKNIKYRLAYEIWKEFTGIIDPKAIKHLAFYSRISGKTYLQPIPLSVEKIKSRGFNQVLLITKYFNKVINTPVSDFLFRTKDTLSQAELKTRKARYNNLRGAFKINSKYRLSINNARVILIDDIITTGSTVQEAAKILKKSGAEKVYVLALAKG